MQPAGNTLLSTGTGWTGLDQREKRMCRTLTGVGRQGLRAGLW